MSKIDTNLVHRIARLAHIGLTDSEALAMSIELESIVSFVEQLQTVDIAETTPTDQVTGLVDVMRPDVIVSSMDRSQALLNAPDQQDGYFKVKRVQNG
jgi:aspartyl-tRNA(Asn)/glutamyl-tRNA(Gln) amidotransferase subunit C